MANKCILLVRVSSKQQDYTAQKQDLIDYAIKEGYKEEKDRIIIENKESAIKNDEEHRQGIAEMKTEIEKDSSIDCVFCWEISRLGRRYDVLESVRDFLISHKINLKLYREGVQLLDKDGSVNASGKLVVDVSMAIAKYEMDTKIARLQRDRDRKTVDGKTPTGRVLYGYYIDKDGYVQIDEETTAPRIREIFDWARNGKSTLWIWDECQKRGYFPDKKRKTGKGYICAILSQPAYYGGEGKNTKTKYKPIISKQVFDKVQNAKQGRRNKPKSTSKFVAYGKGIVKYVVKESEFAMCIGHSRNSYRTVPCEALPKSISVNMNVIDFILWRETVHLYTQYLVKKGERTLRQFEEEKKVLEQKIIAAEKRIKSLLSQKERKGDRYDMGELTRDRYIEDIKLLNNYIQKEQDNLNNYKIELLGKEKQIQNIGDDRWAKIDYKSIEGICDDDERKRIIDTIITSITVSPFEQTETGDKKYKIRINQRVNWLYNKYFEYWQRGGVFHLIEHSLYPIGDKEYIKDISKDIVRRFESDWSIRHPKQ